MVSKKITIESLAIMMAKGFEQLQKQFGTVQKQLGSLVDGQNLMRTDIQDLKMTVRPLSHTNIIQEREIDELKDRVERLEQKVGVK
jgi:uncharacterized phage infection (PIP) family protein YhgE